MCIICPLMYEARDVERMMAARATAGPMRKSELLAAMLATYSFNAARFEGNCLIPHFLNLE
jgi:hypothetical protein